jgi:hypothetical protein
MSHCFALPHGYRALDLPGCQIPCRACEAVLVQRFRKRQILSSKEYGASYALLELAKQLGLDRALYSRKEPWVGDCLAMIVGRLIYAGSKLALSNQWKNTALWELCGTEGKVDVEEHCYQAMDRLLERQSAIQRTLASRHRQDGHLVLYDITSSYFEGAYLESDIVICGYNRDGKRGHEQMVIALLCSAEGSPVGVEVFAGNTQDASTVAGKIAQLQSQYGLKEIIFVGDRGMITHAVAQKIKAAQGLHTISALTHRQIVELLGRKVVSPELFDKQGPTQYPFQIRKAFKDALEAFGVPNPASKIFFSNIPCGLDICKVDGDLAKLRDAVKAEDEHSGQME